MESRASTQVQERQQYKRVWQFKLKRAHAIQIKFVYKSNRTEYGQYIKIVGNIPQLGISIMTYLLVL